MKLKELTPSQISSVRCATCGAAPGKSCVLLTGAPRSTPHVDRKFSAAQTLESAGKKKNIHLIADSFDGNSTEDASLKHSGFICVGKTVISVGKSSHRQ